MKKHKTAIRLEWPMDEKIFKQICRFNPGDERPANSRSMKIDGPMLRLALELASRAWFFNDWKGSPISVRTATELVAVGAFDTCIVYSDFDIKDDEAREEYFCLWRLVCSSNHNSPIEFLSPTYGNLQRLRNEEVEKKKVAGATKKPKGPRKSMRTRTDTL